jgi:hypothetical protein
MSAPPDSSASVQRQLDTNHPHHPHQIWQRAQFIKPVVQKQIDPRVQMRQMIQRADQMAKNQASFDLESRLNASKDGSSPLAPEVIRFMEPRFGADFRGVRVHTGGEAMQMNQELGEYGESLLTPQERSRVQELLSGMNGINRNAALFIAGAFYQWLRNNGELGRWVLEAVSLGTSSVSEDLEAVEESLPKSGPFEMGRTAGDLAGIVTGVLEMIAGGGAVAGGGSLCLTGIGCIAGAPATVVGGATVVHGGSVVVEATGNLAEDLAGLVSQVFAISGGRGRPPEFPGGTLTESEFLSAVEDFLGSGYTEVSPGRYLSTDGMRQVRFGSHETRGLKLHGHFEAYDRPGGRVVENTVVDIVPDP